MSTRIRTLVLLIMAPLLLTACSEPPQAPEPVRPIKAIEVGSLDNIQRRSFPGEAKAALQADMSFRISGDLISRPVDVGDQVKKGDLLASLDPQDHQNRVKSAQANLERARANLKRSASDYKRVLRIFKQDPGATSQADIDRKRQQRDQDKANVKSSSADLANMQNRLDYTYLKAPFDGKIVATYVENYESVRAKQNIVRLLDASGIEMVVHVPENMISLVKYVEAIYVVFDAFPDTEIRATVKEIGAEASKTTRTYPVTLAMQPPEGVNILPGMAGKTIRSDINLPESAAIDKGTVVPTSALFNKGKDTSFVWMINRESGLVTSREVKVGALTDRGIRITEGLKEGEWIATAGVNYLTENQKVRIIDANNGRTP